MLSKRVKKSVGFIVLCSQIFSILAPVTTFAAATGVANSDIQNSLETVGTKANRLKTVGNSGVDESSGAFTYTYPFSLPKGLNGLEPSINLSYNSQATENSIIGYGWNMAVPYIERSAKFGVDKIYTKNDFVSSLGGELIPKTGTTNEYLQKIDDGSYQVYTLSNNIFTLRDRSGNVYTFGATLDSRLSDETNTKIQKYYLTEVRDILGNKIKYFYEKKNNFVYPKEIIYTVKKDGTYSNKIVFEREVRGDEEISYKSQFRVEMKERIKKIHVYNSNFDNNFTEVAKLELTYTTGQNGTRSLLSNVKESRVGTDGLWSTLPDTKFEYEKGTDLTFQSGTNMQPGYTMVDITGDAKPESVSLTEGLQNGLSWTFVDYNGDYLLDKYYSIQSSPAYSVNVDTALIYKNIGGSFVSILPSTINLAYTGIYNVYSQPVISEVSVVDINADGLQDFLTSPAKINTGISFVNATATTPTGIYSSGDFNGDGLIDIIKDYASSTNASSSGKYVFLNNGNGWNLNPEFSLKIDLQNKIKTANNTDLDIPLQYVDINADGLTDVLLSYISNQTRNSCEIVGGVPVDYVLPNTVTSALINTGSSFSKKSNINIGSNFAVNYESGTTNYTDKGIGQWCNWYTRPTYFKNFDDVNFDGSVDFGGGVSSFKKQDILKTVVTPLGAKSEIFYYGSVNQNNPKLPINILTVSEIKTTETNKNLVESTKYKYENGKMYFDKDNVQDRRFAGFQKVTTETGTTASGKRMVKYFHQGDGDDAATFERGDSFHNIGRVYKEEVYGVVNNVATKYAETYRIYGVYNWDGQIYKYPKLEVVTEYDKNGNVFSKASQYDYDLAARLPKKTENFGEVKWDITTGTFADSGEDYVLTKNIYNTKRPQKLLAEESYDVNGKFLDKKIYLYDELPFGYVEKGLLSEERNYSSENNYTKTNYTYNSQGLVASKTDNNGAVTTFTYDANYNPVAITNGLGQTTNFAYEKINGQKVSETGPNGKMINTVYDGFGNVKNIGATSPKDDLLKTSITKNILYSLNGMTETENIYSDGLVYKTSVKTYDSFGRLIKSQNTNTDSSNQTIDVVYNNLGQMVKVSYPYDNNGLLAGYFGGYDTNYVYDSLGRNVSVSQGDLTNYTDYVVNGKITLDNTPQQHKKEYKYNALGKLSAVREYVGSSYNETKYEWNLLGNLTKLTDAAGNVRNFQYDSEGRLLKQEDLHAPTDNTFATYSYTYDINGNLTSKKDPSGNIATYEYDLLNRPKKESFGIVTNYIYDTCVNGVGNLCEVNNENYSHKIFYKKSGNTSSETKIINDKSGNKTFTNSYEYNDLGQNVKIILPDNSYISYTYDTNGKQKTASITRNITQNGNTVASTTQIVTDAKYNIDGTLKNIVSGNNLKTCYEYNGTNGGNVLPRLSKISVVNSSDCNSTNLLFGQELKYNLFGSIIENKETFGANNFNSGVQNIVVNKYEYDVLQRLTKSEKLENNLTMVNNMTYNSIGNILSSDSTNYSYTGADYQNPHAPSVIGTTQMTYDLNGNVLSDNKNQYEWTQKNTLEKVANEKSVTEYVYDVGGERIKEIAKVKSTNSSSTFMVSDEIQNFVGTSTEQVLVKDLPYVSENTFTELNTNKLASQNKVEALFALALESNKYVKDVCKFPANVGDANCKKKEVIKFVASYLYIKHNIKLSATALEEMYRVYVGDLKISSSQSAYDKNFSTTTSSIVGVNQYGTTLMQYYYQNSTNVSIQNLVTNIDISSLPNNKKLFSTIDIAFAQTYGSQLPVDLYVNNVLFVSGFSNSSTKTFDISEVVRKMKLANQNNLKLELKYQQTGIAPQNIYAYANPIYLNVKEFEYKNNINTQDTLQVNDSILNTLVYGTFEQQDKNLLGYVYKQKKIASLFGSSKLISKETFSELNSFKLTLSDIIIKDMLIDVSFAPYATCDQYAVDEVERKCRKEIFVKYLFAITKYETDREMSPESLDELYEVVEGNLAIPNNVDEYKIRDTKIFNLNSNEVTHSLTGYYGYAVDNPPDAQYRTGCQSGFSRPGQLNIDNVCDISFNPPQDLLSRKNEVESATIRLFGIQGRGDYYNPNVFNVGQVYFYPVISNNIFSYNGSNITSSALYTWNVNPNIISTTENINLGETTDVNVTSLINGIIKGELNNFGLRIISSGNNIIYTNAGKYDLTVKFAKDAPQNDRKYLTPLVTNPKDTNIYSTVLQVLARIDKDYQASNTQIVSAAIYAEIKNTNATSTENLLKIFEENEKLQKDDTLKAVWDYYKNTYTQELTREALEEMYMVWTGKISLPIENEQYNWTSATTTKVLASVGTTTVKSYVKILSTNPVTEGGVNYLNISVEPAFSVFDKNILTNLSVVPGVFSVRSLADADIINTKMFLATSSKDILKSVGIEKRADILQFTTTIANFSATSTVKKENKIDALSKINSEIKRIKNISLSRESLEEIYYILNNKLIINNIDFPTAPIQELGGLVSKYEFSGNTGSVEKRQDTMRPDKPIFFETGAVTTVGKKDTPNSAYQFVGNGFLKSPAIQPIVTNNPQTISFWMKANTGGNQVVYSLGAVNGTRNFLCVWYKNGYIIAEIGWTNGGGAGIEPVSTKAVNDNLWHKIDVTFENSPNATAKIYIDGALDKVGTGSAPFNMANVTNEIIFGAFQSYTNGAIQYNYNGNLDDVKVYNRSLSASEILAAYTNDLTNTGAPIVENLEIFDRSNFKLLEPITGVVSEYENKEINNITYNITTGEVKNISTDTIGELKLVNITTKQQILDVFNLTKTLDKDSKISFFKEYFEAQKQYTFSREALEEIYLLYTDKATFNTLPLTTIKEKNPITITQNGNNNCYLVTNSWTCNYQFTLNQKPGYLLTKAALYFNNEVQSAAYGSAYKAIVDINGVSLDAKPILDIGNYIPLNTTKTYTGTIRMNVNASVGINVGVPELEVVYEPILISQEKENFGELTNVSTEKIIDTSYTNEINSTTFNTGTTSTTTVVRVTSPVAFAEMVTVGATTSAQIKSLFATASSSLGKDAKLYFVWKNIKDTKNVELTRLTLEEMWNINIDRQVATLGQLSTTTTTVTPPTPLASIVYYKMDGATATNDKRKDEILNTRTLTENGSLTTTGRNGNVNGGYTIVGSSKLLAPTPLTLTNNSMTYSVWAKTTNNSPYQRLMSQTATDGTRNFIDLNIYSGKPYFEIGSTISGGNREGAGFTNISNNTWYKYDLVVTNSPNGTLRLYVNGVLDSVKISDAPYNFTSLPTAINLSCYGNTSCTSPFYGSYDDFKIYNKALTEEEILKEYQLDTNQLPPTISTSTTVSIDVFNRDRYKELDYISPVSVLKYAYDVQTGLIVEDPLPESIKNPPVTDTNIILLATLDSTSTEPVVSYNISTTTLALLNPFNYPFTPTSLTSIDLYLNGVTYNLDLNNYSQFYLDLSNNTLDTLAKYINKVNNVSDEVEYVKFIPSQFYEYDSRGFVTINVPFNGKIVATLKYTTDTNTNNLQEISFVHNDFLSSPAILSNTMASVTNVITRNTWGEILQNSISTNNQTNTEFGFTGHKYDEQTSLTYGHARYLNNTNRVWLSHDPFSINNFSDGTWLMNPQIQNSYSYANNNPVNMVDPDGKLTIIVPGTYYTKTAWNWSNTDTNFFYTVAGSLSNSPNGDETIIWNDKSKWSGANDDDARRDAAQRLADFINNYDYKDGEQLNLVGHSHGGNVIKETSGLVSRKINNAITISTPQRGDHKMNMNNVENYINVYSWWDGVQISGGEMIDNKPIRWVTNKFGYKLSSLEGGPASRKDFGAKYNINMGASFVNPKKMHTETWSNTDFWSTYVAPVIQLPKK